MADREYVVQLLQLPLHLLQSRLIGHAEQHRAGGAGVAGIEKSHTSIEPVRPFTEKMRSFAGSKAEISVAATS